MAEYWLISTPLEKNPDDGWKQLYSITTKVKTCEIFKFFIPVLKVGTLDTLLADSDNLSKLEMYLEGLLVRLANGMGTAYNIEETQRLRELFLVRGQNLYDYLVTFRWDVARFPTKQTIKSIADLALKQGSIIESEYKLKFQDYLAAKTAYEICQKNEQGSLLTRNLTDIIKKEDYISDSIYLSTVFVIVPKKLLGDWYNMYERFDETVVPKSSRIITEDPEYYLVGVTVFQKNISSFTENCRKFKFLVRQFKHDDQEEMKNKEKVEYNRLKKEALFQPLVNMLRHQFCEVYINYVHVKAARIFVESVLRYGLPPHFRTVLMIVGKKDVKKVRDILYHLYKHLDAIVISDGDKVHLESGAAVGHNPADYYPYVTTRINTDII
ncbi:hypothetical protein O3M35_007773 [Rhynocoris fuscipes]|uniref:V-type proton ATPase subunit C n=1 Tax=Rhynocoris fuscipes TaxID=488301 RepID=A0AAW1DC55_9HEMI